MRRVIDKNYVLLASVVFICFNIIVFTWHYTALALNGYQQYTFSFLSLPFFIVAFILTFLITYIGVYLYRENNLRFLDSIVIAFLTIIAFYTCSFLLKEGKDFPLLVECLLYMIAISASVFLCIKVYQIIKKKEINPKKFLVAAIFMLLAAVPVFCFVQNDAIKSIIIFLLLICSVFCFLILIEYRQYAILAGALLLIGGLMWSAFMGYEYGNNGNLEKLIDSDYEYHYFVRRNE